VPALDHLDLVVAAGQRVAAAPTQVVHHLAQREDPEHVGIEVREVHGRPGELAGSASLVRIQLGPRAAALQAKGERLGRPRRAGDDVAAPPELLEGQDPDGLLTGRPRIRHLRRVEQVAGHLAEALGVHPAADVLDGDHGVSTPPPQDDPDALAAGSGLGVLVGRVGDELVQRVLRVLVGLPADEHGFAHVPDAQPDPFGHGMMGDAPRGFRGARSPRTCLLIRRPT
jgi:hypothetical protein